MDFLAKEEIFIATIDGKTRKKVLVCNEKRILKYSLVPCSDYGCQAKQLMEELGAGTQGGIGSVSPSIPGKT